MKIKNLAALMTLAIACASASAENFNTTVTLSPDGLGNFSGPFAVTHLGAGAFTDTFNFGSFSGPVDINGSLVTIGTSAPQDIDFVSAFLNGVAFSFTKTSIGGVFEARERGGLASTRFAANVPLLLTVTGRVADGIARGQSPAASYSGTLNLLPQVSPVPEPGALSLLLAGLASVVWVARRRSRAESAL